MSLTFLQIAVSTVQSALTSPDTWLALLHVPTVSGQCGCDRVLHAIIDLHVSPFLQMVMPLMLETTLY